MQLGALIRQLENAISAAEALEIIGDIVLFAEVQAMGEVYGETPGQYAANAARRFSATASHDDWLRLTGALAQSSQPAEAALEHMLRWALAHDAVDGSPTTDSTCGCRSEVNGGAARP